MPFVRTPIDPIAEEARIEEILARIQTETGITDQTMLFCLALDEI